MARQRSALHYQLESLMLSVDPTYVRRVFFQAPEFLPDPCIKYERDSSHSSHADNKKYASFKRYQVTVIDRDPDSPIPDRVEKLEYCRFDRYFTANGLNHWVFNIYF